MKKNGFEFNFFPLGIVPIVSNSELSFFLRLYESPVKLSGLCVLKDQPLTTAISFENWSVYIFILFLW